VADPGSGAFLCFFDPCIRVTIFCAITVFVIYQCDTLSSISFIYDICLTKIPKESMEKRLSLKFLRRRVSLDTGDSSVCRFVELSEIYIFL